MGRFALQQDNGEDDYSDVDSYDEGSHQRWSSDSREQSRFWRSDCPSTHSMSMSSTFHRALTRFHRGPLEEGEIPEDIDVIPQEDEDTYSSYSQQQPQQLARYEAHPQRPQYHLNPAAPIHYHIYYTAPQQQQQEQQPMSQSQSSTPWKWIALAAIISHVTYIYGPSARTLQESGLSPFTELMATGWFAVCQVVWSYADSYNVDWRLWRKDVDYKVVQDSEYSLPTIASCISNVDTWPLFGQPIVLDLMKEALDKPASTYDIPRPLTFYAVGGSGVGKRHMAHLLAQSCSSTLLEVDLSTLPEDDDVATLLRNHLVSMDKNSGVKSISTVFLLSHLSLEDPTHAKDILQQLVTLFNEYPEWWQNVILVVTSRSGAITIDKAIRHYGKDSLPKSELVQYLRQSLQLYPELSSATILPFVPLERSSVQTMVQTLLPMNIGSDDLNYLLDNTLEWETWIDRQSQMELYTFLPKGGHDVTLLIQQLLPPDSCNETLDKDSAWLQVKNGNQLHLVSCVHGASNCDLICQYPLV